MSPAAVQANRRKRAYHRGNTGRDALREARRLLHDEGPRAVTTTTVADALGVSRMAISRFYPTTASLLDAVSQASLVDLGEHLVQGIAEAPKEPHAMAHAYLDWALNNPHEYKLIFGTAPTTPPRPLFEESGQDVPGAFDFGLPSWDGDPARNPAFFRWVVMHGLAMLLGNGPLADLEPEAKARVQAGVLDLTFKALSSAYPK